MIIRRGPEHWHVTALFRPFVLIKKTACRPPHVKLVLSRPQGTTKTTSFPKSFLLSSFIKNRRCVHQHFACRPPEHGYGDTAKPSGLQYKGIVPQLLRREQTAVPALVQKKFLVSAFPGRNTCLSPAKTEKSPMKHDRLPSSPSPAPFMKKTSGREEPKHRRKNDTQTRFPRKKGVLLPSSAMRPHHA